MMRRTNGFKLGRRVVKLWRWVLRGRPKGYLRFAPSLLRSPSRRCCNPVAMTRKLFDWSRRCLARRHRPPSLSGGDDAHAAGWDGGAAAPLLEEGSRPPPPPPKGHLAVYVGGWKDGVGTPPQRYLLPVIYFNHPLFGELLEEAAAEFGYQHPGGITIPCPVARFERVKTRIAAAGVPCRRMARSQLSPGTHDHHS